MKDSFRDVMQESALFKELKASQPFFLMAGPNVIQSEEHCMRMCRLIKSVTGSSHGQLQPSVEDKPDHRMEDT